jgi:hypothetical protein
MEEPVASDFIEAYASGDVDRQMDILGEQITVKVVSMWPGREGRTFTVKIIHRIVIHG